MSKTFTKSNSFVTFMNEIISRDSETSTVAEIENNYLFFIDEYDFVHWDIKKQEIVKKVPNIVCSEKTKIVVTKNRNFVYISYGQYGKIKKYDVKEQKICDFNDYVGVKITSLLLSDDDLYLYAGDISGNITVFDMQLKTQLKTIKVSDEKLIKLLLSDNQTSLYCIGSYAYRYEHSKERRTSFYKVDIKSEIVDKDFQKSTDSDIIFFASHYKSARCSSKREHLYTLKRNGELLMVDATSGKTIRRIAKTSQDSKAIAVNPTNQCVYYINEQGKLKVRNTKAAYANDSNDILNTFDLPENSNGIKSMVVSACGEYLIASDFNGFIMTYYQLSNKQMPSTNYNSNKPISALAA